MDQDKEFLSTQMSTNNEIEKEDKWLFLLLQFGFFWASWCSFIFPPVVLINVREDVHGLYFSSAIAEGKGAGVLHMHRV